MTHRTGKDVFSPRSMDFGILEKKLQDPCATPMYLPVNFLKAITRDFSEEQELGRGGFGVVYKGVLRNGKVVAVKKLSEMNLEDAQFQHEVTYLMKLKHQNIVQLVGYCAESRWEAIQVDGRYIMAEIRKRLICFEYINNKSLDKHLYAESCELEWHKRFEIIRGICCGLHYLHTECLIIHLDLKPQNILMDDNMVPKIADFGISRLFGQQQSRIITESRDGTLGYMAPEYLADGLITTKSDIFSLGVIIIELMTGSRNYPRSSQASFGHFIKNVVGKWRKRLEKTPKYIPMELYIRQVNACIGIGLRCVHSDPNERPAALDIIKMLNAAESTNRCSGMNAGPLVDEPDDSGNTNAKAKLPQPVIASLWPPAQGQTISVAVAPGISGRPPAQEPVISVRPPAQGRTISLLQRAQESSMVAAAPGLSVRRLAQEPAISVRPPTQGQTISLLQRAQESSVVAAAPGISVLRLAQEPAISVRPLAQGRTISLLQLRQESAPAPGILLRPLARESAISVQRQVQKPAISMWRSAQESAAAGAGRGGAGGIVVAAGVGASCACSVVAVAGSN